MGHFLLRDWEQSRSLRLLVGLPQPDVSLFKQIGSTETLSRCSRAPPERIKADLEKYNSYFNGEKKRLPDHDGIMESPPHQCAALCRDKVGGKAVASECKFCSHLLFSIPFAFEPQGMSRARFPPTPQPNLSCNPACDLEEAILTPIVQVIRREGGRGLCQVWTTNWQL